MTSNNGSRVRYLVVDSAAFIKRARLETFGEHAYTSPLVIREIRDAQTRAFLKSLPYSLSVQQPTENAIKIVKAVAKRTGDLSVLSSADIEIIALTYELHQFHVGEPVPKDVVPLPANLGELSRSALAANRRTNNSTDQVLSGDLPAVSDPSAVERNDLETNDAESDSGMPDEADWITEENFDEKVSQNFGLGTGFVSDQQPFDESHPAPVVACLSTDFAVQNVLIHSGLCLISINGFQITRLRTNVLWCGSCFQPTKRNDTYFCPSCGQANLRRIPVTLHEDGHLQFHFSRRYDKSLRGLQQPIHIPKGGKYANEPIYCADQRLPDRRPAKLKNPNVQPVATNGLLDCLDDDEFAATGPLGGFDYNLFPMHDVNSRSARIGLRADHQIAPRSWLFEKTSEHGLKPTRGKAHLVRPRTGNKKRRAL